MRIKKKQMILLFIGLFTIGMLQAQVGINTKNPQGVFHIDGDGKNSAIPTAAEQLNDVIITEDGNVGIGTLNPQVKLHIVSGGTVSSPKAAVQIQDGTEQSGFVFTSDALGIGKWSRQSLSSTVLYGTLDAAGTKLPTSTKSITQTSIDLTPGTWLVMAKFTAQSANVNRQLHTWIGLASNLRTIQTGAAVPEISGNLYSLPSIYAIVVVTAAIETVFVTGKNVCEECDIKMSNDVGGSSFYAIKLSE
jgi:hypothetical protein